MQIGRIDTLEISFDVESYNEIFKEWIMHLENHKILSQQYRNESTNKKAHITIENNTYEVFPNGAPSHAYILHGDLFDMKFAKIRSQNENFYPIFIKAHSSTLWAQTIDNICAKMFSTIRNINKQVTMEIKERIKRVDLCCHTDDFNVKYKNLEEFQGNYVHDDIERWNKEIETVYFGTRTSPVYCRIYNKTREVIKKKSKLWFINTWEKNGFDPSKVWNIEFEIKRKFLSSRNINSVYDLLSNLKTLWVYCTSEWLQHKHLINTRIERCPVSEKWEKIQSAFNDYLGQPYLTRKEQSEINADGLVPAITGYLTRYASCFDDIDIKTAINNVYVLGEKYLNNKNTDYESEINKKKKLRKEVIQ